MGNGPEKKVEAYVRHEAHVLPEVMAFLEKLPQAILAMAATKQVEGGMLDMNRKLEQLRFQRSFQNITAETRYLLSGQIKFGEMRLRDRAKTLEKIFATSDPSQFTVNEMVNAMFKVVHGSLVFLQGKMKTNFDGEQSNIVEPEEMIKSTIVEIECMDGSILIGLSKEEAALSFATNAAYELEFD